MSAQDPWWLATARRYIGQSEFDRGSNPWIASLWIQAVKVWQQLGADDSSAPWCGMFVRFCIVDAGIEPPAHPYRARDWLNWGTSISTATVGCVVVFSRTGGGHVGFVIGKDRAGNLMVLGGNQGNKVSVMPFAMGRVLGYRWPMKQPLRMAPLPLLESDGRLSTGEA